jgi:transcriptional regulator with XRE-family HTH domain
MGTQRATTDRAALSDLGARLARQRLERNLTQDQLAREAGVSKRTVIRLEKGESTQLTNLVRVLRALSLLGNLELLVPAPPPSPIAQLESRQKQRRRASPRAGKQERAGGWTWGDEPRPRGEP